MRIYDYMSKHFENHETSPLISVIMGVYNCHDEQMAKRAVNSILAQSFTDFEFIICDDGSTNDTYIWLKRLAETDSRIILLKNEKNESLAITLDKCLLQAKGTLIARQDIDDFSEPLRFEKQVAFLKQHKELAFVGSNCTVYDNNGIYANRIMPEKPTKKDFLKNSPYVHGTLLFRKEALVAVNGYKPCGKAKKYEDYDMLMKLYERNFIGANLQENLYNFYSDMSKPHVSFQMRLDETAVRFRGFKHLGLMPKGFFCALRPLAIALLPHKALVSLKRKCNRE